jgi:quercetin dioxygenase-like cupin family protein
MSAFARRFVQLEPGAYFDHREGQWQDAIVFLLAGELAVECSSGERHCFRAGDILTLARLPIGRVHNSGTEATRLLAIWRASPVSLAPADRHTDKDPDPE